MVGKGTLIVAAIVRFMPERFLPNEDLLELSIGYNVSSSLVEAVDVVHFLRILITLQ